MDFIVACFACLIVFALGESTMIDDEDTTEDLNVSLYSFVLLLFLLACGVLAFFAGLVWYFGFP